MNSADHGGDTADELLAEAIVDDAVRRRRAEGWGRRRALDDVTVAATLLECVGEQVVALVATGEELRGTVTFAGARVVHLDAVGTVHWIRADAVVAVTPTSGRLAAPAATSAGNADDPPLTSLLADLLDDERTVELHFVGGATLSGVVSAVGTSLVVADPAGNRSVVDPEAVLSVTLPC